MPVKKVKNRQELQGMALKQGATVTSPTGQSFNTAQKKVAKPVVKKKRPAPKEPDTPDVNTLLLADKMDSMGAASVEALKELKKQISMIQLTSATPPTEWLFDFVRDENGNLKQIKATADSAINKNKLN